MEPRPTYSTPEGSHALLQPSVPLPTPMGVTTLALVYQAHGSGLCLLPLTVLLPVIDHAQASCKLEDEVKRKDAEEYTYRPARHCLTGDR